jgi:hypothetical protein
MISFIVPAHNEQTGIGRTLQAIHDAAGVVGQPYEIIVVNDASTDNTAEVARHHNATVLPVNHRQIAATRNSGGRAAHGERLFFVDADTIINPRAVASALRCMDNGAVGGGAPVQVDGIVPLYIRIIAFLGVFPAKVLGMCGGAFMYCTHEAFHATGGFDERLFWGEEGAMGMALKREGRFVVIWERVLTSGRRFRVMSGLQILAKGARMTLSPFTMFTRRSSVEKIWYDSNRENDDKMPNTLGVRASNGSALLILIVLLTGPIWEVLPISLTPWDSPLGKIRFVIGTFLCHVGLVFWPCAIVLFGSLLRRMQWMEWIKLAALFALCLWQAWDSTQGVIAFWTWLYHWLTHFYNG